MALVEEIDFQWSTGNVRYASTSASASRSLAATLGKFGSSTASAWATASAAVSGVGCRKIDFTTASTADACSLGTALATLGRKCTLQRCQVAPVNTCARALRRPSCASEMTSWAPLSPQRGGGAKCGTN